MKVTETKVTRRSAKRTVVRRKSSRGNSLTLTWKNERGSREKGYALKRRRPRDWSLKLKGLKSNARTIRCVPVKLVARR